MIRDISIKAVLNGYVVQVGCQTVVFNTADSLVANLRGYLLNPEETEKNFSQMPNARHTLGGAIATGAPPTNLNQQARGIDPSERQQLAREVAFLQRDYPGEFVQGGACQTTAPRESTTGPAPANPNGRW